jgi:hypothetical protein
MNVKRCTLGGGRRRGARQPENLARKRQALGRPLPRSGAVPARQRIAFLHPDEADLGLSERCARRASEDPPEGRASSMAYCGDREPSLVATCYTFNVGDQLRHGVALPFG